DAAPHAVAFSFAGAAAQPLGSVIKTRARCQTGPCSVQLSAVVTIARKHARTRSYRLTGKPTPLAAGQTTALPLALTAKLRTAIRAALAAHGSATATITATAS